MQRQKHNSPWNVGPCLADWALEGGVTPVPAAETSITHLSIIHDVNCGPVCRGSVYDTQTPMIGPPPHNSTASILGEGEKMVECRSVQ